MGYSWRASLRIALMKADGIIPAIARETAAPSNNRMPIPVRSEIRGAYSKRRMERMIRRTIIMSCVKILCFMA